MTPEEKLARRLRHEISQSIGQGAYREYIDKLATAFVRMGEALRETGVGMLVDTDASDDHDWVTHADEPTVVWCQWCGVHKVEVPDWMDRPQCPAFVKVKAALAAFDARMKEEG